jgi:hypothetical protein
MHNRSRCSELKPVFASLTPGAVELERHESTVYNFFILSSGDRLATCNEDGVVRVFSTVTVYCLHEIVGYGKPISAWRCLVATPWYRVTTAGF